MHEGFPGDTGWESSRPRCGETERSPWTTDGDPRFLSSQCFTLVPGTMKGGRAGAWSQGSKDKWLDLCLRSIAHTEPVVGAVRREGLWWGRYSWVGCSSAVWVLLASSPGGERLSQTGLRWPSGRDFLGLVSKAKAQPRPTCCYQLGSWHCCPWTSAGLPAFPTASFPAWTELGLQ